MGFQPHQQVFVVFCSNKSAPQQLKEQARSPALDGFVGFIQEVTHSFQRAFIGNPFEHRNEWHGPRGPPADHGSQ
jgi:hypothetical protein